MDALDLVHEVALPAMAGVPNLENRKGSGEPRR